MLKALHFLVAEMCYTNELASPCHGKKIKQYKHFHLISGTIHVAPIFFWQRDSGCTIANGTGVRRALFFLNNTLSAPALPSAHIHNYLLSYS